MSPRDANESKLFFHLLFSSTFPAKSKAVFIVVALPCRFSKWKWDESETFIFCYGSDMTFALVREREKTKPEIFVTQWNSMELDETRWNSMKLDGTRWNSMELDGTRWNPMPMPIQCYSNGIYPHGWKSEKKGTLYVCQNPWRGPGGGVNAVWAKSQGGTPFWPYFIPFTTPHPLCASFINGTKSVKDWAHFSAFPLLKQHCQPIKNETKCIKQWNKTGWQPWSMHQLSQC